MKLLLSIALFVFLALSCKAQCVINERDTIYKDYYLHSTKDASYEDGETELADMLSRSMNMEGVTDKALIFGQQIILFIYIDEKGNVKNIRAPGYGKNKYDFFERQVIAILSEIKWIPGECDGVKVPTRKYYFVRFGFRRDKKE